MHNTLTEIAVVLNRSGSMESARTDTIGGFNTFLAEQVDDAGDVNVTLARMTVSVVAFGREGAFVVLSTVEDAHDGNGAGIFVDRIGDHGSSVVVSKP